ncbi:hypothetical protein KIN20_027822 [Parelaphostrongylus tenuis]|uniref:C2H2-type domain-containing protein n=1 Tax=Parelaphostrongylus tenuis TaxID=148309 RepID=A0AAD5WE38_PARTN|nr:hypothetical protein KIN20_027822 [Parelaphostrongylus tenuis]
MQTFVTYNTLLMPNLQKSQLIAHETTHVPPAVVGSPKQNAQAADDIVPDKDTTASSVIGDYQCKFCGKRYAYASSLYVHTRLHTGERPFRCQFCDKSFTNQGNMQVHKRVHTGERPYTCNSCGKSYAQKVGLNIHLEHCAAPLPERRSKSPVNTDIDFDSSDGNRKVDFSLPNIYPKSSSPMGVTPLNSSSTFTQWNIPDILDRQPVSSYEFHPAHTITTTDAAPAVMPFRAPEPPPPDFGPLKASKPPMHRDVTMSETSAFYAPTCTKSIEPMLDEMTTLKGLVESGLSSQLLPLPSLLSQQLLNTQLLIQQLQNNDALLSILNHNVSTIHHPPVPSTAPSVQTTALPHSFFESLFPACLVQSSLPISYQPTLQYSMEAKPESMLV